MKFGEAIEKAKEGKKITRAGWNGKGMFIYYVPKSKYKACTKIAEAFFGQEVPYRDYLAMKTVNDEVVPWVASQSDILEEDWMEV